MTFDNTSQMHVTNLFNTPDDLLRGVGHLVSMEGREDFPVVHAPGYGVDGDPDLFAGFNVAGFVPNVDRFCRRYVLFTEHTFKNLSLAENAFPAVYKIKFLIHPVVLQKQVDVGSGVGCDDGQSVAFVLNIPDGLRDTIKGL